MNIYGHWVREVGRANKWSLNRRLTSCNAGWGYTIQISVPFSPLSACQPIPDRVGTPRARDRDCFLASAFVKVLPVGSSVEGSMLVWAIIMYDFWLVALEPSRCYH